MKKTLLLLFALCAALVSCTQYDELEYNGENATDELTRAGIEPYIVLGDYPKGKKAKVPYTVSTMREACQNFWDMKTHFDYPAHLIFDTTVGVTIMPLRPDQIEANYYHVKFHVRDVESYNALMTFYDEIEFSDIPFDYRPDETKKPLERIFYENGDIIEFNDDEDREYDNDDEDYVHVFEEYEEEVDNYEISGYIWALVHVDQGFPSNVEYEIKDEWVFKPDYCFEDNTPSNFLDFVFIEACYVAGYGNDVIIIEPNATKAWSPKGRIRVWDDYLDNWVPLAGLSVYVIPKYGKKQKTYTDENGYFGFDHIVFYGEVAYEVEFEGRNFRVLTYGAKYQANGNAGFSTGYSRFDLHYDIDRSFRDYGDRLWGCATIFRAGEAMFLQPAVNEGFKIPYKTGKNKLRIYYNNWDNAKPGKFVYPGGYIRIYRQRHASAMMSTIYHEFGHYIHYYRCNYKYKNYNKVIKESWARFTEWTFTERDYKRLGKPILENIYEYLYPYPNPDGTLNLIPFQTQIFVGSNIFYLQDSWNKKQHDKEYTPLFIDLYDSYNQRHAMLMAKSPNYDNYPDDWIQLKYIGDIQYLANRSRNIIELKNRLKRDYIGNGVPDMAALNNYFDFYYRLGI